MGRGGGRSTWKSISGMYEGVVVKGVVSTVAVKGVVVKGVGSIVEVGDGLRRRAEDLNPPWFIGLSVCDSRSQASTTAWGRCGDAAYPASLPSGFYF